MAPDRVYVPDGKGTQLQAQGIWSAGEGDDQQRFLADLRALRDAAALGYDELAVRTHYPDDVLKEAESGPSLPGLPILAAYVRACNGDVPEWEERWRRLGFDSRADPGLPVRPAGASPAAAAGARVSVDVVPPDAYDPERIRAVLRGIHHSDRGTRGAASRGSAAVPGRIDAGTPGPATAPPRTQEFHPGWDAGTGQDDRLGRDDRPGPAQHRRRHLAPSAELGDRLPAGRACRACPARQPTRAARPPTGTITAASRPAPRAPGTRDEARADAIRRDPFSADWLQDSELAARDVTESGWQDHPDTGPSPAAADSWFTPPERADTGLAPQFTPLEQGDAELAAAPPAGRHAPRPEADGMPAAGVTELRPPAEEHDVPRTSWPALGEPRAAESSATESSATEPWVAEPRAAEPRAPESPGHRVPGGRTPRRSGIPGTADRTAPVPVADVPVAHCAHGRRLRCPARAGRADARAAPGPALSGAVAGGHRRGRAHRQRPGTAAPVKGPGQLCRRPPGVG